MTEAATLFEDVNQYRLEKIHRLERENEHLRAHRAQLERILALALQVATKNADCAETDLLALLEDVDRLEQA